MSIDVTERENPDLPVQVVPEASLDSMLGTGGFPSANLLPPAIVTRRQVRIAKRRALLLLAGVVGLLVLFTLFTAVQQRSADQAKAQAQQQVDAAAALKQRYAYVPAVYQAVTTARQDLATAMGQEVQVSRLLAGLSSLQPPALSLTTMNVTVGPGTDESTMTADAGVIPGVGVVSFQGEAKSMADVATWIERLRNSADYDNPVLTDVTTTPEGLYTFSATAELTDQALSGRYVEPTR